MLEKFTKVASVPHHDLLMADTPNILILVPEAGFRDTVDLSRLTMESLRDYVTKLGRKCGIVIIANNLAAQDAESRRVYAAEATPDLFFGITIVVNNPVARIIGNLIMRLNSFQVPITLVDRVEDGVAWLKTKQGNA
jgi:hypothetical protein